LQHADAVEIPMKCFVFGWKLEESDNPMTLFPRYFSRKLTSSDDIITPHT
jgi:hypothetical protein